jgi:hypothetical protein
MEILNRTPHAIALIGGDGVTRIIEKTGSPVRIETEPSDQVDTVDTVPVHAPPRVVRISNLPPRQDSVTVVVSQIAAMGIAALHPERTDVVYPGTGPGDKALRTQKTVFAATRLIRAV